MSLYVYPHSMAWPELSRLYIISSLMSIKKYKVLFAWTDNFIVDGGWDRAGFSSELS